MNEFDPETKALFGAARVELEPTLADRSRLDHAMAARLGVAVVATSGAANAAAAGAASAVKTSTFAVVAKWIGVGAFVGLGAASGYVALRGTPTVAPLSPVASAVPARSPVAPTVLPDAPPPATTLEPQATPPASSGSASSPRTAYGAALEKDAAPEPVARVAAETALLRRAHEALNHGDANRALALLREHTLRFPNGILVEERSAELVQTLCRLGRTAEARSEAERFLKATPDSPLTSSVKSSCAAAERSLR